MAGPHYWTGGASGVFNLAANWSTAAVPANGEIAIFDSRFAVACTDGSGVSAVDLAELRIEAGYAQAIGGGTALTISADKVVHRGSGKLTYVDGAGTTDRIEIDSENQTFAADISGTTNTLLVVSKGAVTASSGTFTRIEVDSHGNRTTDATLTISSGVTYTDLVVNGGTVTDKSTNAATSVTVIAGAYSCTAAAARTITTLETHGGTATLAPVNVTVTVTTARHFAGTTTHSNNGGVTYTASHAYNPATVTFSQGTTLTAAMVTHGSPTLNIPTGKTIQIA